MARTRYRYNPETKALEEIGSDWSDVERRAPVITEELVYGNQRMPDGSDVSSRKKHREYLRATGMAMASDFTETTPKVRAENDSRARERREIRETVGRALHEVRTQRKR